MATQPQFAATPVVGQVTISAANSARDGTNAVNVLSAASAGTKINRVIVEAGGTTTAGTVRLFIHNGITSFLFDELLVAAITASAAVVAFRAERSYSDLVLPTGYSLRATTEKAETFYVTALAGNL
jgi:hypothetical protein